MKAEDLIKDKFKDYIEDNVLVFEKWDVIVKDIKQVDGEPQIIETVVGESKHGITVENLAKLFRTILEDDVTFPDNKMQAMIDDEIVIDGEKEVSRGTAKYLQILKDGGIEF